jgi:hypothetical protein
VEILGLLELTAQLSEPRLVRAAGVGVEHLAGISRRSASVVAGSSTRCL